MRRHACWLIGLFSALLLVGCQVPAASLPASSPTPLVAMPTAAPTAPPSAMEAAFPGADAVPGWTPRAAVESFDRDTIFQLVNGQADFFFAYGFEQVAVRDYEDATGAVLSVEIWQLATPADAYGLFTTGIAGDPIAVGNEGDTDPGRRLIFWQARCFVHVRARQEVDDAVLRGFAEAVAAALPAGGARPALVDRLPAEGLVARSAIFFREELSIQNDLWLGGENLLGLSQETGGVLARYEIGGAAARLLLVQYPDAAAASDGLAALEGAGLEDLVAGDAREALLGAVFGEVDGAAAEALLAEALGKQDG